MSLAEALRTAFDNLSAHRLRSALTMLGMIFGVAAVIAMLSIGAGAQEQALAMIEEMGLRNVIVRSEEFKDDELREMRKKSTGLSLRDASAIEEAVPGVDSAVAVTRVRSRQVLSASGKSEPRVLGVSHRHAEASGLKLAEGRFFSKEEDAAGRQLCVIGPRVRRELFGFEPALGQDLKVADVWLTVIGVLETAYEGEERVEGVKVTSPSNDIYLPVTAALHRFSREPLKAQLDEIIVRLSREADAPESAAVVSELLSRLHGGVRDYSLVVPEALLAASRRTQRLFNVVMGCIAGISLLVGGIGIMNIMLATVLERTREIGVRRAVGARREDIRNQFIIEAFAISVLGGLAGIGLGLGGARLVAAWAGWTTIVTVFSVALAAGVSLAVGLVFGIYPAVRAAELHPIEALRHE